MASTTNNPKVLLKRTFSLKDQASLILCTDTLGQTGRHVLGEFIHHVPQDIPIIYVSFESVNKPKYARQFIEASGKSLKQLIAALQPYLPQPHEESPKMHLVIFDSLNYIASESLTQFISAIASPFVTILGVYHQSMPEWRSEEYQNYPSSLQLLQFIANTVIEVSPKSSIDEDELENELNRFAIPSQLNTSTFHVKLACQ